MRHGCVQPNPLWRRFSQLLKPPISRALYFAGILGVETQDGGVRKKLDTTPKAGPHNSSLRWRIDYAAVSPPTGEPEAQIAHDNQDH